MTQLVRLAIGGCVLAMLAACGGTPDCGSGAAIGLLSDELDETIERADEAFAKRWNADPEGEIEYTFESIRTLLHDEGTDTYQCNAVLVASTLDEGEFRREVGYTVYSVEGGDADFEVEFDKYALMAPVMQAQEYREQAHAAPLRRAALHAKLFQELDRYRNAGDWRGEGLIADDIERAGLDIPPRTPEQHAKFGPAPNDFYGNPLQVPGGEP